MATVVHPQNPSNSWHSAVLTPQPHAHTRTNMSTSTLPTRAHKLCCDDSNSWAAIKRSLDNLLCHRTRQYLNNVVSHRSIAHGVATDIETRTKTSMVDNYISHLSHVPYNMIWNYQHSVHYIPSNYSTKASFTPPINRLQHNRIHSNPPNPALA